MRRIIPFFKQALSPLILILPSCDDMKWHLRFLRFVAENMRLSVAVIQKSVESKSVTLSNAVTSKITVRLTTEKLSRHNCSVFEKNTDRFGNWISPTGFQRIKTRRKFYWATVGNRRPNVVSLVIDNKFGIFGPTPPTMAPQKTRNFRQRYQLISNRRSHCRPTFETLTTPSSYKDRG